MLKERWLLLMTAVPDIAIGGLKDDIDFLINDHLNRLSEDDTSSAPSVGSQTPSMLQSSAGALPQSTPLKHVSVADSSIIESTLLIPRRSASGMGAFNRNGAMSTPETAFFHQSFPDNPLQVYLICDPGVSFSF